MIIDRIMLQNIGPFKGINELILTPQGDRPIVLIGGMNGSGKTTLLDSVQLCLYGKHAKCFSRGRKSYRDYLEECVFRRSNEHDEAKISMTFRIYVDGRTDEYDVSRELTPRSASPCRLHVTVNGKRDALLATRWDEYMEGLLPARLAPLFFFDGEQVQDMADEEFASTVMTDALRTLLGLEAVDQLDGCVQILERRSPESKVGADKQLTMDALDLEITRLDEDLASLALEEGSLRNDLGRMDKETKTLEESFRKAGGESYLRRSETEGRRATETRRRDDCQKELRKLLSGCLPLAFIPTLVEDVIAHAGHEARTRSAIVLSEHLSERDSALLTRCTQIGLPCEWLDQLQRILAEDRSHWDSIAHGGPIRMNMPDDFAVGMAHLARQMPDFVRHSQELVTELNQANRMIDDLERELSHVPSEEGIKQLLCEVSTMRAKRALKEADLRALQLQKAELQRKHDTTSVRLQRAKEDELQALAADDLGTRIRKWCPRVRATLSQLRERLVARHLSSIAICVEEALKGLLHKESLVGRVSIDSPSLAPKFFDLHDNELVIERLSAGERQLLATALVWGLARASGRSLPTIIDTPLGRLDSEHREKLCKWYFPSASHQVILLSTDAEIRRELVSALRSHVSHYYLLAYDASSGSSTIQKGFFDI